MPSVASMISSSRVIGTGSSRDRISRIMRTVSARLSGPRLTSASRCRRLRSARKLASAGVSGSGRHVSKSKQRPGPLCQREQHVEAGMVAPVQIFGNQDDQSVPARPLQGGAKCALHPAGLALGLGRTLEGEFGTAQSIGYLNHMSAYGSARSASRHPARTVTTSTASDPASTSATRRLFPTPASPTRSVTAIPVGCVRQGGPKLWEPRERPTSVGQTVETGAGRPSMVGTP